MFLLMLNLSQRVCANTNTESPYKSEWIGVASYQGYSREGTITWTNPPTAKFWSVCTLKGPPGEIIPIRYDFGNSESLVNEKMVPLKNWKFEDGVMPKKDSKWIILIPFAVPKHGAFQTFQGPTDAGVVPP